MKSILYVGATLMIGASIYGFVDYKKTSRSKEFSKMYESKEATTPLTVSLGTKDAPLKKGVAINEKPALIKGKVDEIITRTTLLKEAPIPGETTPVEVKTISASEPHKIVVNKPLTSRKFSYKLFSRARLDERSIDKELKTTEPEKTPDTKNKGE